MGLKLVIADDAPFIREAIRNVVGKSDIHLIGEACDGQEAVDVVLKLKPDVVLMDLVMPNKNGIEASKEILEKMPKMKIIACSTIEEKRFIMKAIEAGCCSYISKPFEAQDLIRALHKAGGQ